MAIDVLATPWTDFPVGLRAAISVIRRVPVPYVLFRTTEKSDLWDAIVGIRAVRGDVTYRIRYKNLGHPTRNFSVLRMLRHGHFSTVYDGRILLRTCDMYSDLTVEHLVGEDFKDGLGRHGEFLCAIFAPDITKSLVLAFTPATRFLPSIVFDNAPRTRAAVVVQRRWKQALSDPGYALCRKRLLREFDTLAEYL